MENTISRKSYNMRRMIYTLLLLAAVMIGLSLRTEAADMIADAKANVVSGGSWKETAAGSRYKRADKTYVKNVWASVGGKVYRFDKNGYIKTGWFTEKNVQYYASRKNGVAYNKKVTLKKVTYYFDGTGAVINKTYSTAPVYLFVGDSRTVGMDISVDASGSHFIGKIGMGYQWLKKTAVKSIEQFIKKNKNVVIIFNFGVNDLKNISSYISWYRKFSYKYPAVSMYFMSVNPVRDGTNSATNAGIKSFNKRLKKAFGSWYLDTNSYLTKNGFQTSDGLHYTVPTYQKLHVYTLNLIKTRLK